MTIVLPHPDALVRIERNENGKRRIYIEHDQNLHVHLNTWETSYDLELIEHVLRVKGPSYLCDEIRRDEDPLYVQHNLRWGLLAYIGEDAVSGRRILDFGSGSGASSMVLARMFPDAAEIIGIDLNPDYVELAEHRARFYGVENQVSFLLSPSPTGALPAADQFDYIVLSAVYEHLLPDERQKVLPQLWSHLVQSGLIFMTETPYRWFPHEGHTTGLPLLNFLPSQIAHFCARQFSPDVRRDESWDDLLRKGIRGGTEREIMGILNRDRRKAMLLEPSRLGARNQIDLWYMISGAVRKARLKHFMMLLLKVLRATTSLTMIPSLSLAIQKIE